MELDKRLRHIGFSYAGVPNGWKPIVEKALIDIERVMWPRWMPMFVKRLIHYLATGNSVVRVKYWWAYRLRQKLTGGQSVTEVKEKYAMLRISAYAGKEMAEIIKKAEEECHVTCQDCGDRDGVRTVENGRWYENLCVKCCPLKRKVLTEKY